MRIILNNQKGGGGAIKHSFILLIPTIYRYIYFLIRG